MAMETTELPFPHFLLIWHNDDSTIVMQDVWKREWSIYNYDSDAAAEERLARIANFQTSNTNLNISPYGEWHTSQALTKWNMKVHNANSRVGSSIYMPCLNIL